MVIVMATIVHCAWLGDGILSIPEIFIETAENREFIKTVDNLC